MDYTTHIVVLPEEDMGSQANVLVDSRNRRVTIVDTGPTPGVITTFRRRPTSREFSNGPNNFIAIVLPFLEIRILKEV